MNRPTLTQVLDRRRARAWNAYRAAPAGTALPLIRRCANLHGALLELLTGDPVELSSGPTIAI